MQDFDTHLSDLIGWAMAAVGLLTAIIFFVRKKQPTLFVGVVAVLIFLMGAWAIASALEASSVGLAAKIKKGSTEYVSQSQNPVQYQLLFWIRVGTGALLCAVGVYALLVKIKEKWPPPKHDRLVVFVRRRPHQAPTKFKKQRGRS